MLGLARIAQSHRGPFDPYWNSVVELLHFDGADASTEVNGKHTWIVSGNAQIDTANAKFGGAMLFDGAGDYITAGASADFQVFAADFTVEFWTYYVSSAGNQCIVEFGTGPTNRLNISLVNNLNVYQQSNSSGGSQFIYGAAPANNVWHHMALVGHSGTLSLYVDGTLFGVPQVRSNLPTGNLSCCIGSNRGLGSTSDFNGAVDEFRVTKGVARYTGNFTPPTAPFPDR